ncbi:hypothetical protein QQL38_22245 [Pseudomonas syringae]|uniref:hypothetical protein n=1 Tax=Pseudomonas syringae TaxID=317 RepID=UPI00061B1425|nr:hypothetical protein [Pseudomonas syringae]MCL6308241.1 hypothetical protein [Pseudomonas syringae]
MDQKSIRPIAKFENAEEFKIPRNRPATIILPAYPPDEVLPAYVGIAIYRTEDTGTPTNTVETAPFKQPVAGIETRFELTLEEMSYIAGPKIKSLILGERYAAQSGEGGFPADIKSPPYTVVG